MQIQLNGRAKVFFIRRCGVGLRQYRVEREVLLPEAELRQRQSGETAAGAGFQQPSELQADGQFGHEQDCKRAGRVTVEAAGGAYAQIHAELFVERPGPSHVRLKLKSIRKQVAGRILLSASEPSGLDSGDRSAVLLENVGPVFNERMGEERSIRRRNGKSSGACAQIVVVVEHIAMGGLKSDPGESYVS